MNSRLGQGYLTLATGAQKYLEMAVVLGLSLKTFDPKRPVCLLHDERVTLPPYAERIFDQTILVGGDTKYTGCMNKARLYDYSPFERTMFIDADCILMKPHVDIYWSRCAGRSFTSPGGRQSTGRWEELDIELACRRFACPYVVVMNSGALYFEKDHAAEQVFREVELALFPSSRRASAFPSQSVGPVCRRAVLRRRDGRLRLEPIGIDESAGSWMVTTWRARRCMVDLDAGVCSLEKPSGFWWPTQARFPKGWVRHSPVFLHFIALKPRRTYRRLAQQLRTRHAGRLN